MMDSEPRILILDDSEEDAYIIERELRDGGLSFTTRVVETEAGYIEGFVRRFR